MFDNLLVNTNTVQVQYTECRNLQKGEATVHMVVVVVGVEGNAEQGFMVLTQLIVSHLHVH